MRDDHAESGTLAPRSRWVAFGIVVVWTVIVLRLIVVQGFSNVDSQRLVRRQRTFVEVLPARPGDIRDRAGRLLATSLRTQSLAIDPSAIEEPWTVAQKLAGAVGIDAKTLSDRIVASQEKQFLWVQRRLSEGQAEAVLALNLDQDQWHFRDEFERVSPRGGIAAHVLGTRDIDNRGRGGVEEGLEHLLLGEDGHRTLVRDARGFVIEVNQAESTEPRDGQNIVLTIDSELQAAVEQRLDALMEECRPLAACAIVIDPASGELLALASRPQIPTHDSTAARSAQGPGDPGPTEPAPDGIPANPDDANGWRNHALASMFEPGSTFKPFVVAEAIDRGLIEPDEMFDCELGAYRMGRRVLHDHHSYGRLSVTDILVKSSNIGMAKIGERLGNRGLFEAATVFGFGRVTGIEIPGELSGRLHPLEKWTSYSTGSIPMGQEIAATPLQMAAAHAALANEGVYFSPHLLRDAGAASSSRVVARRIVSAETARWLVQGPMVEVISRGTGKKAALEGYTVFGKTGTAQKIEASGGYSHLRHVGSFICGAPARSPKAVVLVSVDEPTQGPSHYGGVVAAPTAAAILKLALDYLQVAPDVPYPSARPRTASRP